MPEVVLLDLRMSGGDGVGALNALKSIAHHVVAHLAHRMRHSDLSGREIQVAELMSAGSAKQKIANALSISGYAVRHHPNSIMEKLKVSDRTGAVATAIHQAILPENVRKNESTNPTWLGNDRNEQFYILCVDFSIYCGVLVPSSTAHQKS